MKVLTTSLLLIPLLLCSCKKDFEGIQLGEKFVLGKGQSAIIENSANETEMIIKFEDVIADTRCPIGVYCFWEGAFDAILEINNEETIEISIYSNRIVTTNGFNIELIDATPYPTEGKSIRKSQYELTMVVSQ